MSYKKLTVITEENEYIKGRFSMDEKRFEVTFWGVRGSCPIVEPDMFEFGGNTSCVQMQLGNRLLIFDAGTGIVQLGKHLMKKKQRIDADIFITHAHWDHIQGFLFFTPAFVPGNNFTLYGERKNDWSFKDVLQGTMTYPYCPIDWNYMLADFSFVEVEDQQQFDIGDGIIIKTSNINHPDKCIGYRVDYNGKSCCYITDTEHYETIDMKIKEFVQDTDILIYDTYFTDDEYRGIVGGAPKKDWGHSTWQEAVKLALAANVKKLVLFHHSISRTDAQIREIEKIAQALHPDVIAARERTTITL